MAQTNYYPNATGTITKSGYTYKYRNEGNYSQGVSALLELYNAATIHLDVERGYRDGSQMSLEKALWKDKVPEFSTASQTVEQTLAMVDVLFSTQQKVSLKGNVMLITARINPSTGKIADVYFVFFRESPFANIPVETYRSIELALKQRLSVTPTAEGRRMNYTELYWEQKF